MFEARYSKKTIVNTLLVLLGLIGIMYPTDGFGFAIIVPVLIFALCSKRTELVFMLVMLCGLSIITNSFFMPRNVAFFVVQRVIMLALGSYYLAVAAFERNSRFLTPLLGILFYIFYSIIPSLDGWNPIVSLLKIVLFVCSFFAYYGPMTRMIVRQSDESIVRLRSIMLGIAIFYIVGSIVLIPFPEISQLKGQEVTPDTISLFKGMTTHSQCLGPVVATISVILLGDMLFSLKRFDWLYMSLLILCPILIYKTSSRTGMFSYALSMMLVAFFFVKSHEINRKWQSRVTTWSVGLAVLSIAFVIFSSSVREEIVNFVLKKYNLEQDREMELTYENVTVTRQFLVDKSMYNFHQKPMLGNGFQVSDVMDFSVAGPSDLGRLLSAPIEKGVWVSAVLEEGGVCGMILFCAYCLTAMTLFVKRKVYIGASLFAFMLVSNMAEFSMFSMSYTGGFIWAMLFMGIGFDASRVNYREQYIWR